jgi:hypothetical protein
MNFFLRLKRTTETFVVDLSLSTRIEKRGTDSRGVKRLRSAIQYVAKLQKQYSKKQANNPMDVTGLWIAS